MFSKKDKIYPMYDSGDLPPILDPDPDRKYWKRAVALFIFVAILILSSYLRNINSDYPNQLEKGTCIIDPLHVLLPYQRDEIEQEFQFIWSQHKYCSYIFILTKDDVANLYKQLIPFLKQSCIDNGTNRVFVITKLSPNTFSLESLEMINKGYRSSRRSVLEQRKLSSGQYKQELSRIEVFPVLMTELKLAEGSFKVSAEMSNSLPATAFFLFVFIAFWALVYLGIKFFKNRTTLGEDPFHQTK